MTTPTDNSTSYRRLIATTAILICVILYEWPGYLEFLNFELTTLHILKLTLPLVPLAVVGSYRLHTEAARQYLWLLLLMFAWAILPNLLSGHQSETFGQWFKFGYRLMFYYACCLYLFHFRDQVTVIYKTCVIISVLALFQYLLLEYSYMTGGTYIEATTHRGGRYWGPLGLYGQGLGNIWFPSIKLMVYRLYSFWLEPSNASAFLFMSYFMARALGVASGLRRWNWMAAGCVLAGLCTFSNAGYFAFGVSLLVGQSIDFYFRRRSRIRLGLLMALSVYLILFATIGRYITIEITKKQTQQETAKKTNSSYERAIKGLLEAANAISGSERIIRNIAFDEKKFRYDTPKEVTAGRLQIIKENHELLKTSYYMGIGMRIPGKDQHGNGVYVSGTAPLYWLLFTGLPGVILLVLAQLLVLRQIAGNFPPSPFWVRSCQAFSVIFLQNLLYGTWMSPLYLLLAGVLLTHYGSPILQAGAQRR